MFKSTKLFVLILSLSLLVSGNVYSTPTSSAKHSSSSHSTSFGSFGVSKKSASTDSAASASTSPSTGFGSFGSGSAASGSTTKSTSALSKDLDQNQAQKNALGTYDARNAQRNGVPVGTINGPAGTPPPAQIYQTQPVQTIYRESPASSNWFWFWVGQSFGHHSNTTVVVNNPNPQYDQAGNLIPNNGSPAQTTYDQNGAVIQSQSQSQTPPQKSTSWLLVAIWVIIGVTVAGLLFSHFMRPKLPAKPSNYSL